MIQCGRQQRVSYAHNHGYYAVSKSHQPRYANASPNADILVSYTAKLTSGLYQLGFDFRVDQYNHGIATELV